MPPKLVELRVREPIEKAVHLPVRPSVVAIHHSERKLRGAHSVP